jgi:hypothetical protein
MNPAKTTSPTFLPCNSPAIFVYIASGELNSFGLMTRCSILCFLALCPANAEGLSVIRTAISTESFPSLTAFTIDWKFEPLPEARTPILRAAIVTSDYNLISIRAFSRRPLM